MTSIITKSEALFLERVKAYSNDDFGLRDHVLEVGRWINILAKTYKFDLEVAHLAGNLHDISYYPPHIRDHAVVSEMIARQFLTQEGYDTMKMENVLHCIRAHRNKDVEPKTLEARVLAFSDSASHMTGDFFPTMCRQGKATKAAEKIERDYRDLDFFPEMKIRLLPIYQALKAYILAYAGLGL